MRIPSMTVPPTCSFPLCFAAFALFEGCCHSAAAFSPVKVHRSSLSSSSRGGVVDLRLLLAASSFDEEPSDLTFETGYQILKNFVKHGPSWTEADAYYNCTPTPAIYNFTEEEASGSDTEIVFDMLREMAIGAMDDKELPDEYNDTIYESIWAKQCDLDMSNSQGSTQSPPVNMDDILRLIATASFLLPAGAAVSALETVTFTAVKNEIENGFKDAVTASYDAVELTRTSNPYTANRICINANTDGDFLDSVLEPVRSLAFDVTEAMDLYVYPKNVLEADRDMWKKVNETNVTRLTGIALKTSPLSTNITVLGKYGLGGKVFDLLESTEWNLIKNGDEAFPDEVVTSGLSKDPSKSHATFSLFVEVSLTLVKALQVYAWLSLLPNRAFQPDWDGKENGRDFNIYRALYESKNSTDERSGWHVLEYLAENMLVPSSQFMKRFDDSKVIWNIMLERLLEVSFSQHQPAKRNEIWYLDEKKDFRRMYDVKDWNPLGSLDPLFQPHYVLNEVDKTLNLTKILEEDCKNGQVVLEDKSVAEPMLESINSKFHKQGFLRLWLRCKKPKFSFLNLEKFTLESSNRDAVAKRYKGNRKPTYKQTYTFPLTPKAGTDWNETESYNDIFWKLPGKTGDYRCSNVFLDSDEGRSTIGWLGLVLVNYARCYNLQFDVEHETNTFRFSLGALRTHNNTRVDLQETLKVVKKVGDE
jgi:hypothetical protein